MRNYVVRIFRNKSFSRFAAKSRISDDDLLAAVSAADRGLIDADLGGGVIKQRIARDGQGKSGGFRTIVLFRVGNLAFFVHGFAKSDVGNITNSELQAFRLLAGEMLNYSDFELGAAVAAGVLIDDE